MRGTFRTGLVAGLVLLACAAPAIAAKRVALVVGNDAYESLPKLQKAVNDARAVGAELEAIGFRVIAGENLSRRDMNRKLADLEAAIAPGDTVFFFFSGHGVALGSENVLLPADMPKPKAGEDGLVREEGFLVDAVIRRLQRRGVATSLLVLDACRDNPFEAAGTKDIGLTKGLARVEAPSGVFVLFSAGIGQTALDRLPGEDADPNSVFTRKLVPLLRRPGLSHVALAKAVQSQVDALARSVDHAQQPAYYDQIIGEIILNGAADAATDGGTARTKTTAPAAPISEEARVWPTIESTKSCGILADFVRRFDSGGSIYIDFARSRRKELRCGETEVAVVAPEARDTVPAPESCSGTLAKVGDAERCLQPGEEFRDLANGPEMVVVPASTFTMGSPEGEADRSSDEGPRHDVTIANAFAVGKFEVTFEQWDACVSGGGCGGYRPEDRGWGRGRQPVINVSWDDAKAYAAWLSRTSGKPYRLLSEAEWEYAARAGTTTRYSFGDEFSNAQANNDKGQTVAVGQYPANAFGLHDMHGNVWEWTEDCYADSYSGAPNDGSVAKESSACRRVLRGGSWDVVPRDLRSAIRLWGTTGLRFSFIGFRLARTLTP